MGKNPGQAQRVKDNAHASSSSKAAEMLQNLSNYGLGFGSDIPQIGVGTLMEDSFDSNIDSDFRMSLKKLYKKDALTRLKALEELKSLIESKSQDDCVSILPYWSKSFTKLSVDNDRKIRESCQQTHEKLCQKVNKSLAPYLKNIMPYWILAQSDTYSTSSRIAEASFKNTFNETKQPEVIYFAKDEIINVLYDFLIVETVKSLSDKTVSLDEAEHRYETIIVLSLRGLNLFMSYYFSSSSKIYKEKLSSSALTVASDKLIPDKFSKIFANDSKFWRYARENSLKIRAEFFQLLNSIIENVILNKNLEKLAESDENVKQFRNIIITKIIPLVFYSCDEDNNSCSYFVWNSIVKCLNNSDLISIQNVDELQPKNNSFWSLLNVKKTFIPKLLALIRHHGNGTANSQNCEIIFSSLYLLINKLSSAFNYNSNENQNEKLNFYKDFFSKLYEGITNENKDASSKIKTGNIVLVRAKMINAFFDCLTYVINELANNDGAQDFCLSVIDGYVMKIIDSYLESKNNEETKELEIEIKFQNFILDVLENDTNLKLSKSFWLEMVGIISKKLSKAENHEYLLYNFNNLFQIYYQKVNSKSKQHLNDIVKMLFDKFYSSFIQNFDRKEPSVESNNIETIHLNGLNKLCSNFTSSSILDCLLANTQDLSSLNYHEKLNHFNKNMMENFVRTILSRQATNNDYSLYFIISLYLSINSHLNDNFSDDFVNQSLDHFLFEVSDQSIDQCIENFLIKFLLESKKNSIGQSLKLILNKYIIQSDRLQELVVLKLFSPIQLFSLKDQREYNNYELIIQLLDNLTHIDLLDSNNLREKSAQTLNKFYKSLIKTIIDYLEHMNTLTKVNLNELNNYLLFSIELIFSKTNLLDLNLLWMLLINHLIFKDKLHPLNKQDNSSSNTNKIVANLNNLINKLIEEFITKYVWESKENYQDLIDFIIRNLSDYKTSQIDCFELSKIIIDLANHFEIVANKFMNSEEKNEWVEVFYLNVLFNLNETINFKSLFNKIIFCNSNTELINDKLIGKFYLNKRLNYLYSNYQYQLIRSEENCKNFDLNSIFLKNIGYSLTILNNYLSHQSGKLFNESFDWVYLLLCCIILDKIDSNELFMNENADISLNYFENRKLIKNIQTEFKKLIFQTKFLNLKLDIQSLDCLIEFIFDKNNDENKARLELNNLSLLITSLVDMTIEKPVDNEELIDIIHTFSRDLFLKLTDKSEDIRIREEEIKLYVYDIPFAKHSVIDNLNKLGENVQHYYSLFSNLINEQVNQLTEAVEKFNTLNRTFDLNEFLINIKTFNFNLDILTKYLTIYLGLLNKKPNSTSAIDLKLYQILNCNEITLEFIKNNLLKNLTKILDLFINLKTSITKSNNDSTKNPFLFYFSFKSGYDDINSELVWEQFIQIEKLNTFLQLFFVDFKLNIPSQTNNQPQQLSQYLNNNKHWDFILCYVASISQSLNKLDHNILDKNYVQIMNINFFTLLDSLVKCVSYKVRDDLNGLYPKTIYSDWNGFFAKEILDPLFCLFVKYANHSTGTSFYTNNLKMNSIKRKMIRKLSECISLIPFERLLFNELEAKFNVLDLEIANLSTTKTSKLSSVINLTDQLKTVINHLVPHLKHQLKSIQLCSYKILRTLVKNIDRYYSINNKLDENLDSTSNEIKIIESLPYVIKETLFQLTELFSDLKNNIEFDQNILVGRSSSNLDDDEDNLSDEDLLDNDDEDEDEEKVDHLKFVLLKRTTKNYSSLIKRVQMKHDANNKLMSYLFINRLILDMFSGDELDFKVKLVNNLREIKFNENLINCLFRLMPSFKDSSLKFFSEVNSKDLYDDLDDYVFDSLIKYNYEIAFQNSNYDDNYESFTNKNVQAFACKLYKYSLKLVPAMLRDWFNIQPKRIADLVDKYTSRYVSPVLLEEEIKQINKSVNQQLNKQPSENVLVDMNKANCTAPPLGPAKKTIIVENDDESTIKIRGMLSTREIVTTYKMKELSMELIIHLPLNYPLGVIEVSSVRRLGVSENEWRNWLLQLTTYLTHQNGSIIEGLQIWKKNVDKKFNGVEECTICYSVIQCNDYSLPKMACRTCKKKFHKICLYKWFESSSKSTCPLCRNLF